MIIIFSEKNCPSMREDFGFYRKGKLVDLVEKKYFKTSWNINKDKISVCKDCEYRYVCSDCRASLDEDNNAKPISVNMIHIQVTGGLKVSF